MPKQQGKDRDPLDMWFAQRLRLWWKGWRWIIITVAVLLLLHFCYDIVNGFLLKQWQIVKPNYRAHGWEYYWVRAYRPLKPVFSGLFWTYASLGCLALAHLMRLLLRFPAELRDAVAERELLQRAMRYARRAGYIILGLCYLTPQVLLRLSTIAFLETPAEAGWGTRLVSYLALVLQIPAGVELAWLIALRGRTPWLFVGAAALAPFVFYSQYYNLSFAYLLQYYFAHNQPVPAVYRYAYLLALIVILSGTAIIAWLSARRLVAAATR